MPVPPLTPLAAAVLHVPPPERALEVQCGYGEGVFFLAREFPTARIRGVDRSTEAIREAIKRVGLDPEGRVAFKQGGRRNLPYPDDMFDLVVQRQGILRVGEVRRVLRPGGHLIFVSVPLLPLLPSRPRALAAGLRRRGFEEFRSDKAGGLHFCVARLSGGRARRRD